MPTDAEHPCFELSSVLEVFAARWKAEILWHLRGGPRRFNALRKAVGSVSQKVLTAQLRALERDGLIARTQYPGAAAHVEYAVTPHGESVYPLLEDVYEWWRSRWQDTERARTAYDRGA